MKTAAIATLGCKVNQVESSSIAQQLINHNIKVIDFNQSADIYIINTCTVTNRTDFKSRNLIRHALKEKENNPSIKIIVTGCYAQKERDEINVLGKIDLIVDNQNKVDLDSWLDNSEYEFEDTSKAEKMLWKEMDSMHERTRAFIKIQDGCDYYCSYCAVPFGRGKPRSLDFDEVLSQANLLVENGYKEVVLTGINLGLYKDSKKHKSLADVIKAMVKISKLNLLRISSIEPDLWTDELIEAITSSKQVCPHFHIPLQSGSNEVLKRMGRRYQTENISKLITKLKGINQLCAIGFDVICGFPGETEAEFEETYQFINSLPIAYLHVFGYSKRSRTLAVNMKNQVHGSVVKQRVNVMTNLGGEKKKLYQQQLINEHAIIFGVIESMNASYWTALSDHYIRIYAKSEKMKESDFMFGKAQKLYKDGILLYSADSR